MKSNISFKTLWNKVGTMIIFVVMLLVFAIFAPPTFLSSRNLIQIVTQSSVTMLVACGEFFAILIAGIDLSVGSVVALTGMVTTQLMVKLGMNYIAAILLGTILCGLLCGFINGFMINVTGVHPFIITLGTQSVFRALTLIISNAKACFGFDPRFTKTFAGLWNGVSMAIFVALIVAVIMWFITEKTTFGRNLYVIGGSRDSAWYSGINVKNHVLAVHVISGLCAAIAGAVLTARLGAAEPTAASGYETEAIAASVIGGTSFFGGKGRIPGVIIGSLVLGLISNGLNMCSVPTFYQSLATGLLLIMAVTLDTVISRSK